MYDIAIAIAGAMAVLLAALGVNRLVASIRFEVDDRRQSRRDELL